jgi:hypothetical protein
MAGRGATPPPDPGPSACDGYSSGVSAPGVTLT